MSSPTPNLQRSRWDVTPPTIGTAGATPAAASTPGVTPVEVVELAA